MNDFQNIWTYSCAGYVKQGVKNFLLVPIAFVNEHIETLHELDIEYCHDLGKKVCIRPCKFVNYFINIYLIYVFIQGWNRAYAQSGSS